MKLSRRHKVSRPHFLSGDSFPFWRQRTSEFLITHSQQIEVCLAHKSVPMCLIYLIQVGVTCQSGYGSRLVPDGSITGAHVVVTPESRLQVHRVILGFVSSDLITSAPFDSSLHMITVHIR